MSLSRGYSSYGQKMRQRVLGGVDMHADVRFVDMLAKRQSTVLDIGCGIGNAVNGLRAAGHRAFGIDPTPELLQIAGELYNPEWFRRLSASEVSPAPLDGLGFPTRFDVLLMSGNVPAFLSGEELDAAFKCMAAALEPDGVLVIGTTTKVCGGPEDQTRAAAPTGLHLVQRFGDWHMGRFTEQSPWSVSVFGTDEQRHFDGPDGQFILP